MNQDTDAIFTNLFLNSIFKNEKIFFRDYIPDNITCRNEIIAKLSLSFKIFLKNAHPVNIWITGKSGVGKTTISKFFINNFQKIIKEKTNHQLLISYYNCYTFRKVNSIIYNLLSEKFNQSCRGFEIEYLISNLVNILNKRNQNLILILDEVHILNEELLRILEINETYEKKNPLSVIFISREIYDREINKLLAGRINNIIKIPPYNREELETILIQRAELGFRDLISMDVINIISKIAESTGNARLAIELLYQSGKICDLEQKNSVTLDIVRKAKKHIYPQLDDDVFERLDSHELLALLSIIRKLEHEDEEVVSINQVYPQYLIVCEEFNKKAFKKSTFRNKIDHLVQLSLLEKVKINSKDTKDRNGFCLLESPIHDLENKIIDVIH